MKSVWLMIWVSMLIPIPLCAGDINSVTVNGENFTNITAVAQTAPNVVTIRHDGEFSQVKMSDLPANFLNVWGIGTPIESNVDSSTPPNQGVRDDNSNQFVKGSDQDILLNNYNAFNAGNANYEIGIIDANGWYVFLEGAIMLHDKSSDFSHFITLYLKFINTITLTMKESAAKNNLTPYDKEQIFGLVASIDISIKMLKQFIIEDKDDYDNNDLYNAMLERCLQMEDDFTNYERQQYGHSLNLTNDIVIIHALTKNIGWLYLKQ